MSLPVTANGQDFPDDSRWFGPRSSGTGPRLNFGGYLGVTLLEVNILGGARAGTTARNGGNLSRFSCKLAAQIILANIGTVLQPVGARSPSERNGLMGFRP